MNKSTARHVGLILLVALVLVIAPATLAARGGNGGGHGNGNGGGGSAPTATLFSSCNPSCTAGTYGQFWGSGYDGSQGAAQLYVSGAWTAIPVAADGTVSFTWYMAATGPYDFRVYQNGNGNKTELKAELTVTAQ